MADELSDETQVLRSFTAVFAAQVQAGPIDVEVSVLRRGRSVSQVSAFVHNPGADAGLNAIAVFGREREGFDFTDIAPPADVIPPSECPSFRDEPEGVPDDFELGEPFPFWFHVEGKPVIGHPPWEEYEPTSSLIARYSRFDDPPRADDGAWD